MSKITYANKVALNTNAEIPAQNKISDSDMNNIKSAINEIGSFVTATVATGQPGKCYITMTGTLSANDIVQVLLPSAVNPTALAQLSVDGGTTYYPIREKSNLQLKVVNLSGKFAQLRFNGSSFILLNPDTNIIALSMVNNLTGNTTNKIVPFDTAVVVGTKLTMSSNKILIGAGVSKIMVSAVCFIDGPETTGYLWLLIRKNATLVSTILQDGPSTFKSAAIAPVLISVAEGDLIDLFVDNTTGTPYIIRGGGNTVLTAEVVE